MIKATVADLLLYNFAEYCLPAYHNVNGLQMSAQANILAGIQYKF